MTSEEVEALANPYTAPHTAAIEGHLAALAPLARQIWARPASSWQDIVDRAELAKFWNRHGLGYAEYHGYDDEHADMRLIDAVRVVADRRPELHGAVPTFEPPPALLEWRRLQLEEHELYALRDLTAEESSRYRSERIHFERRLLREPADSQTWTDVVVRAELTSWHRRNSLEGGCWIKDHEGFHCEHRAFAELLTSILRLGKCPHPWIRMTSGGNG